MSSRSAAAVVLMAAMLLGCQPRRQPAPPAESGNPELEASLRQSIEAANPGSQVGVVNAIDPAHRPYPLLSVSGLPADRVRPGTVLSVLLSREAGNMIQATVYDNKSGYLQCDYRLSPGERNPRIGDPVLWFPGGEAVPPSAIQPPGTPPTTQEVIMPATQPTEAPPATQPGGTAPPPPPPAENPGTSSQPATGGEKQTPDLNK